MSNIISKLFQRGSGKHQASHIDRGYVSEYTHFIDQFLEKHPEALVDQHDGRLIYWEKKVDLAAQQKAEQDRAENDGYGFYSAASRAMKH